MDSTEFRQMFEKVPEQQRIILDWMVQLKLATAFAWDEKEKRFVVVYTGEGLFFAKTLQQICSDVQSIDREARLLALDMLVEGISATVGFSNGTG